MSGETYCFYDYITFNQYLQPSLKHNCPYSQLKGEATFNNKFSNASYLLFLSHNLSLLSFYTSSIVRDANGSTIS